MREFCLYNTTTEEAEDFEFMTYAYAQELNDELRKSGEPSRWVDTKLEAA
jgi:hypothetical protein